MNASTFKRLTPLLWTEQLNETIAFYVDVLGFHCGEQNEDWGWAALHLDNVEIMLALPNAHTKYDKISFSGSFYFNVSAVEELWNKLKETCNVAYEIETFEWGMREFAVYDNNGYLLQFGEEITV